MKILLILAFIIVASGGTAIMVQNIRLSRDYTAARQPAGNPTGPTGGSGQPDLTSMPEPSPTVTPTVKPQPEPNNSRYPWHRGIKATVFWVGESESEENGFIANKASAWDKEWMQHFGGIDTPYARNGFYPQDFVPGENPFYIALPYNDLGENGRTDDPRIYWKGTSDKWQTVLKNRWIRVVYEGKTCYGQWEDVGPFETEDIDYVFGSDDPIHESAAIDLSPAVRTCLSMPMADYVDWQFADYDEVPPGPWKEIVTTTGVTW